MTDVVCCWKGWNVTGVQDLDFTLDIQGRYLTTDTALDSLTVWRYSPTQISWQYYDVTLLQRACG